MAVADRGLEPSWSRGTAMLIPSGMLCRPMVTAASTLARQMPCTATVAPTAMPTGTLCSATAAASTMPAVRRSWWPQAQWWGLPSSSWWALLSIQQLSR